MKSCAVVATLIDAIVTILYYSCGKSDRLATIVKRTINSYFLYYSCGNSNQPLVNFLHLMYVQPQARTTKFH